MNNSSPVNVVGGLTFRDIRYFDYTIEEFNKLKESPLFKLIGDERYEVTYAMDTNGRLYSWGGCAVIKNLCP